MNFISWSLLQLVLIVLPSSFLFSQSVPHFEARTHESHYHGPGRNEPFPDLPPEVLIGYFGPTNPSESESYQIWMAAQLAVDVANRQGGYKGSPFRLMPVWSENPWSSGISQLAKDIYTEKLWAIIGSIDGSSTHLVEQLVAKARVPLINPVSSDKTVNLANVPWMFSCLPGEHLQAPVLSESIANTVSDSNLTILSTTEHDSRIFSRELKTALSKAGVTISHHFELYEEWDEYDATIDQVLASRSATVVIIAGAAASAHVVRQLRKKGFRGQIYGSPSMGQSQFLLGAGSSAVGATFPLLTSLSEMRTFTQMHGAYFGTPPDYRALQTYDAVNLIIRAIRMAGLNRARIRDAVRALSPWEGISGPIVWDPLGQNQRPVRLGTVARNQVVEISER